MSSVTRYEMADGSTRWRVRYRTPGGNPTMKRGFSTKKAAEQWAAENTVSIARGVYVAPSAGKITFRRLADEWLAGKVNLKARTRAGYRHSLDSVVAAKWGSRGVATITHADVQKWVTGLADSYAANSVRIHFNVFASVMKYAVKVRAVSSNPAEDVNLPRAQKKRRGYLTHGQVDALAEAVGTEWSTLVYVLAYTGLRWGELCALRVSSVQSRRLDVSQSVARVGGKLHFTAPKKHQARSVPFPAFLAPDIADVCRDRARDELLFPSSSGSPLSGHNFRARTFKPAIEGLRAKDPAFPSITVHDLRHTAASLAISAGANVKVLQRMLGHSSAAMTLDAYADLFEDDLDAVANAMDAARRAN